MTREEMNNIINLHGLEELYHAICDETSTAFDKGHKCGFDSGRCIGYDRGYRVGYNDGLNHSWCRYSND